MGVCACLCVNIPQESVFGKLYQKCNLLHIGFKNILFDVFKLFTLAEMKYLTAFKMSGTNI